MLIPAAICIYSPLFLFAYHEAEWYIFLRFFYVILGALVMRPDTTQQLEFWLPWQWIQANVFFPCVSYIYFRDWREMMEILLSYRSIEMDGLAFCLVIVWLAGKYNVSSSCRIACH
ncbi:hypothetical protein BDZ91DRAFT_547856 [Kalaharituber pfeilii]|nr:hypothetical protein BDZ91DRAFT_547856 [Kalaharituber pfeilii]